MQFKKHALYKEIEKYQPDLSTDFSDHMLNFSIEQIKLWTQNPKNLILKVKGLGRFYWRKKEVLKQYKNRGQYVDPIFKNAEEHQRFVEIAEKVLQWYDDYDEVKCDVRKERYGDRYLSPEELKDRKLKFMELGKKDKK